MRADDEDRAHAEFNERVRNANERSRSNPDDWSAFFDGAEAIDRQRERLDAYLAAMPKPKPKPKRRRVGGRQ